MIKIFITLIFISFNALSCEIVSYAQIIKINSVIDDQIIKSTTCNEETNQAFINFIKNSDGLVSSHLLGQMISNTEDSFKLSPKTIKVRRLDEEIQSKLSHDYIVEDLKSLYGTSTFNLDEFDSFSIECSQCDKLGQQNIKLILKDRTYWLTAKIGKKMIIYKTSRQINSQEQLLLPKDFEIEEITTFKPDSYFLNIDSIKYYRNNRVLSKGTPLRTYHLTSKNLIQYGQKVSVNIKNKSVQLKTSGIAKKAGKFGDFINIENPTSHKTFLGRVIDYNKVEVQL